MDYYLAVFDKSTENKWYVLNKKFILEHLNDKSVNGIFLSDMWFNKALGNGDYLNSLHFILIETNFHKNYVLDDLNRLVCESHIPSELDLPLSTSKKSMYFILEKSEIKAVSSALINNGIEHKQIKLVSKALDAELKLSINYDKISEEVTISLPKFTIY